MKKVALFIILLSGLFLGQNRPRPGVDYLPHIGFFDFIINYFGLTLPETGITGLT
jgi:hypothetical protein